MIRTIWKRLLHSGLLGVLFFLSFRNAYSQSPSYPLQHWVYSFLDRLQSKKIVRGFLPGTRPYSRMQIARILSPLLKDGEIQARLSAPELEQLAYLKLEFQEELAELGMEGGNPTDPRMDYLLEKTFFKHLLPGFVFQNHRNLVSVTNADFLLRGDVILDFSSDRKEYSFKQNHTISTEKHGIFLWGRWGRNLQYFFDFRDALQVGGEYPQDNKNWSFERVGFANAQGNKVSFDETNTGIFLGRGFFHLMIGKERNKWGPGRFGNLMLSDWATSYDQLKMQFRWHWIQFTAVSGFLRSYPPVVQREYRTGEFQRSIAANKYLAAHRLEFAPVSTLIIGFQEALVYGERNLEPAYLNPINFYWSAEHYLGDQDNSTLGADFTWFPGLNLKIYGELFLDDLQTGKLNTDWYGNKWALLAGFSVIDLVGVSDLDLHLEWTRIRPFVYSHRFPINVYKHFTSPLGHWAGPNSETLGCDLEYRRSRYLLVQAGTVYFRHGANPPGQNMGGDMNLPHRVEDPQDIKTFAGELETRTTVWIKVSYELFRNAFFNLELRAHKFRHFPDDIGRRRNGSGHELIVQFSWNAF